MTARRIAVGILLAASLFLSAIASSTAWIAQNHVRTQARTIHDQQKMIDALSSTQDAQAVLSLQLAESQRHVLRSFGSFLDGVAPNRELASR